MHRWIQPWRLRRQLRTSKDTRPCSICGLGPKIRLGKGQYGQFCLYYGVRIAPEESQDVTFSLRAYCIKDGNHFTWPTRGYSAKDLLAWRINHTDWYLKRTAMKVAAVVAIVSVVLSVVGTWLN
ncbi:MAG: hypothetical protein ACR2RB_18330 [Gammaproteobacteria bacterium]